MSGRKKEKRYAAPANHESLPHFDPRPAARVAARILRKVGAPHAIIGRVANSEGVAQGGPAMSDSLCATPLGLNASADGTRTQGALADSQPWAVLLNAFGVVTFTAYSWETRNFKTGESG